MSRLHRASHAKTSPGDIKTAGCAQLANVRLLASLSPGVVNCADLILGRPKFVRLEWYYNLNTEILPHPQPQRAREGELNAREYAV